MRKQLRFALLPEKFNIPPLAGKNLTLKWDGRRSMCDPRTILCEINEASDALWYCLLQQGDTTLLLAEPYSPKQLMDEFQEGIAWVTSDPVGQWYQRVDDLVKKAFSRWIERITFFQSVHMREAGPGVVYAYWVRLYQTGHIARELEADFCLSCRWHGTQTLWFRGW